MGDHSVKNIARAIHVYRLCFDGTGEGPDKPALNVGFSEPARPVTPEEVELAFWKSVETGGVREEYKAYLERYPEGSFAVLARARLHSAPQATANAQDRSVELAFWAAVNDSYEPEMFRAYLDKYPDGEFSSIAEIQLNTLPKGRPQGP